MGRKLKDQHPTKQKFDKLQDLAFELGLVIRFDPYNTYVVDQATQETFELKDLDDPAYKHHPTVREFPYSFEYRLVVSEE